MPNYETSASFRITLLHNEQETPFQIAEKFRTFLLQYATVVKDVEIEDQLQTREIGQHG
jgi:hypothetical protein